MMNFKAKKNKGFTIIELLIVIVIMSTTFGGAVVGYREFARRQAVKNNAKLVQTELRRAQSRASSGERPSGCAADEVLNGYFFDVEYTGGDGQIISKAQPIINKSKQYDQLDCPDSGALQCSVIEGELLSLIQELENAFGSKESMLVTTAYCGTNTKVEVSRIPIDPQIAVGYSPFDTVAGPNDDPLLFYPLDKGTNIPDADPSEKAVFTVFHKDEPEEYELVRVGKGGEVY